MTMLAIVIIVVGLIVIAYLMIRQEEKDTKEELYFLWKNDPYVGSSYPNKTKEDFERWYAGDLENKGDRN